MKWQKYFLGFLGLLTVAGIAWAVVPEATKDGTGTQHQPQSSAPPKETNNAELYFNTGDQKYHQVTPAGTDMGVDTALGGGGGSGTVTSVNVAVPSGFVSTGGPITTSGTITVGLSTESASALLIAPTAGGTPTWRTLSNLDLPAVGAVATTYCTAPNFATAVQVDATGRVVGVTCSNPLTSTGVTAGSYGDATHVATYTVGADGRLTAAASTAITGLAESAVTNLVSDLSARPTGSGASGDICYWSGTSTQTGSGNATLDGSGNATFAGTVSTSTVTATGDVVVNPYGATSPAFTFSNYFGAGVPVLFFGQTPSTSGSYIYGSGGAIHINSNSGRVALNNYSWEDGTGGNGTLGQSSSPWRETWSRHFVGSQATAPTVSATGTGVSSASVSGSDAAMEITWTQSSSAAANSALVTVAYNASYAVKPKGVQLRPVNAAAAAMDNTQTFYIDTDDASTTTGGFVIKMISSAGNSMSAGKFSVEVIQ